MCLIPQSWSAEKVKQTIVTMFVYVQKVQKYTTA